MNCRPMPSNTAPSPRRRHACRSPGSATADTLDLRWRETVHARRAALATAAASAPPCSNPWSAARSAPRSSAPSTTTASSGASSIPGQRHRSDQGARSEAAEGANGPDALRNNWHSRHISPICRANRGLGPGYQRPALDDIPGRASQILQLERDFRCRSLPSARPRSSRNMPPRPTTTGSPEVQVAILSERIANLTEHFKGHGKDQPFPPRPAEAGVDPPPPSRLRQEGRRAALQDADRAPRHPPLSAIDEPGREVRLASARPPCGP